VAAPKCLSSVPIKLTELDPTKANDLPCFGSATASNAGISGGSGAGNSYCSSTQWDISATATDPTTNTGTSVELHQGIGKRIATGASPC
jgi:hypothetical protein